MYHKAPFAGKCNAASSRDHKVQVSKSRAWSLGHLHTPALLQVPSPAEESTFLPWRDGPVFFPRSTQSLGLSGFDSEQECIQSHPRAWLGAAHIPGKFSGRKSLWKRVGVYSTVSEAFQNHEWVSIRGQSSIGWELSLLVAYLWQALKCG